MWMTSRVVWEFESDGSAGQENESEGGLGAVEAVGASDEKPDLGVEPFMAAVGEPALGGGVDAGAVLTDGAPGFDELGDAAALSSCAPTIEQLGCGGCVQVAGEDFTERFLEFVGAPKDSTCAFHFPQGFHLGVGEVGGIFQQRPAGTLERLGDALIRKRARGLPRLAAHGVEAARWRP